MPSEIDVVVEVLVYVHRNRRFIMDGEPRTSTSTFTQLLSSVRSMFCYRGYCALGGTFPAKSEVSGNAGKGSVYVRCLNVTTFKVTGTSKIWAHLKRQPPPRQLLTWSVG